MRKNNKFEVKFTKKLLEKAETEFEFWKREGQFVAGVYEDQSKPLPDWIDEQKLKDAQKIVKDIYTSLIINHYVGLMFLIQLPNEIGPLLATGQSKNCSALFSRYLSTILHVKNWYKDDLLTANSNADKSIRLVRSMHKLAEQMMNSQYPLDKVQLQPEIDESSAMVKTFQKTKMSETKNFRQPLWVNQWDMLLTQWAFLGPLMLEPNAFGVHGHNKHSLEMVMYLWRVIAHLIGIRPEFSLFTDCDYDLGVARCKIILERVYIPTLSRSPVHNGVRMGLAITKGLRSFIFPLCWAGIMRKSYALFNIDATYLNTLIDEDFSRVTIGKENQSINQISDFECRLNQTNFKTVEGLPLETRYNEGYEVLEWNGLSLKKVKLRSKRDYFLNLPTNFFFNVLLRSRICRNLLFNYIEWNIRCGERNQNKLRTKCKMLYDNRYQFDQCPFSI